MTNSMMQTKFEKFIILNESISFTGIECFYPPLSMKFLIFSMHEHTCDVCLCIFKCYGDRLIWSMSRNLNDVLSNLRNCLKIMILLLLIICLIVSNNRLIIPKKWILKKRDSVCFDSAFSAHIFLNNAGPVTWEWFKKKLTLFIEKYKHSKKELI